MEYFSEQHTLFPPMGSLGSADYGALCCSPHPKWFLCVPCSKLPGGGIWGAPDVIPCLRVLGPVGRPCAHVGVLPAAPPVLLSDEHNIA